MEKIVKVYRYPSVAIDEFSEYGWCIAMKHNTAQTIAI